MFLCVVNVSFAITGTVLNILVLLILLKSQYLRKKLCYFMIMVLSCFDLLTVVTNHPIMVVYIVTWLKEKYDLLSKLKICAHFANMLTVFSLLTLLVMSIERYLGAVHPVFHRTSVTRRSLLALLVILFTPAVTLQVITVNELVLSYPVASIIFGVAVFPPFFFINYKLFRISRKVRQHNAISPEVSTMVQLKSISTCLLAVACLMVLSIPMSFFIAFSFVEESTSIEMSYVYGITIGSMNSTFNCLIFFWKNNILSTEAIKLLKPQKNTKFTP